MKKSILAVLLSASAILVFAQNKEKNKIIIDNKEVKVYVTANNSNFRLSSSGSLQFKEMRQPGEGDLIVFVNPASSFQTIKGIGSALTDAAAETFFRLPGDLQKELLKAYYDKENGIGYSLARTNINSCDFSSDTYTYVADNDAQLKTFNLSHDKKFKIPFIKEAIQAAGGYLPLIVSPWSPPAWMKDNNSMLKGGKLRPEFYQSWANYFVKFIKGYESLGVPIWGLTVQNEPMATQRWESCIYTAEEERDFIKKNLGPALQKNDLAGKRLIAWDHNRDLIYQRANTILSDPAAAKYVWGIGYHWYETWTGAGMNFQNVKLVAEAFPNKNLVFTEGCIEKFDLNRINDWKLGEYYGKSLVNDFNNGTVAWLDWNILLDEKGGPNHVGNFCFAPIHADLQNGKLLYTNIYYYIGHFSKFVRPGAKRIACSSSRDFLTTTAFRNTDGSLAIIILNATDQNLSYYLWIDERAAQITSMPHSISTIVIK